MFQIWWKYHSVTLLSFCVKLCSMSNIYQATYRSTEHWMLSTLNKEICPFRIHFCEVNLNSCISSTILLFFCNYFKAGDLKRPMVHMASQKRRGGRGGEEPSGKKKKPLGVHWEQLPRQKLGLINPSWVPWVRVYDIRKIVNTRWPQEK